MAQCFFFFFFYFQPGQDTFFFFFFRKIEKSECSVFYGPKTFKNGTIPSKSGRLASMESNPRFGCRSNILNMLHGINPVRLNGSFVSKCTRPETSHLYQSFTILINTSTGIIVDLNNLRFKWHNDSRHQTVK